MLFSKFCEENMTWEDTKETEGRNEQSTPLISNDLELKGIYCINLGNLLKTKIKISKNFFCKSR